MEHWTEEFEHESITDDNRESFIKAMSKYDSEEAAIIGGFNAMKEIGKPYKLPESLDKLPDDDTRANFRSQANKLLGIELADSVESLADIDFKAGIPEGSERQVDDNIANMLKKTAVEKKWPKSVIKDIIELYNGPLTKYVTEAQSARLATQKKDAADKTNEALIAHFGSAEKVKEQSELLRRAIQNNAGLSAEEYEKVGDLMADSMLTKDPVMAKAMLTLLSPLSAESTSENGKGAGKAEPAGIKPEETPTGKALGW